MEAGDNPGETLHIPSCVCQEASQSRLPPCLEKVTRASEGSEGSEGSEEWHQEKQEVKLPCCGCVCSKFC